MKNFLPASYAFCAAQCALTIAFPRQGARYPFVEKLYAIGAAKRGVEAVEIQGEKVEAHKSGAWGTLLDVTEGTNTIEVVCGESKTNVTFFVAAKPPPSPPRDTSKDASASTNKPPEKVWEKLDYCGDEPKAHPAGKKPEDIVIAIDPGHGGNDTGAISPHGLYEKNANLLLASAVVKELTKLGYKAYMTREDDRALVLTSRPRLAYEKNADAFVSIHHNAPAMTSDPVATRFTAVYYWNDIGKNISDSIIARVASAMQDEVPSRGSIHANFAVTRNPEIPSCLVEADFISSPAGESNIFSIKGRQAFSEAIARGIDDWAKTPPAPPPPKDDVGNSAVEKANNLTD